MSNLYDQLRGAVLKVLMDDSWVDYVEDPVAHQELPELNSTGLTDALCKALNPVVNSALDKFDEQGVKIMDLNIECAKHQRRAEKAESYLSFIEQERGCFELVYDEGSKMFNCDGYEHVESREHRDVPYTIFTIGSQHIRAATLIEALDKAIDVARKADKG